jgi:hypothetical protein
VAAPVFERPPDVGVAADASLEELELEVSEADRPRVIEMLKRHYSLWEGRWGHVEKVQHKIPTTAGRYVNSPTCVV